MISEFMGVEYGHGACAIPRDDGPSLAPRAVRDMFPNVHWTMVTPEYVDIETCMTDRFAENTPVQRAIYDNTPTSKHIMIGGDHSVNFGHFAALADRMSDTDLCLVYIDAHFDIHTPETSRAQATGSPHGCNVHALLGDGDARWMAIPQHAPLLRPENLFFIGVRSFEPAEQEYVNDQNIFVRYANELQTTDAVRKTIETVREKLADRPFVVSFDFDSIDPKYFPDVLVPEQNGLSPETVRTLVTAFRDAYNFEFVEYAPHGDAESAALAHDLIKIVME
ncbi:MAG: arginase family protein [Alphaproteobacteria bacterium]|nr:arginase family protein [Alphaproteobacteria bacterium]